MTQQKEAMIHEMQTWGVIDIAPLTAPLVPHQLIFAFCETANCGVELKVTEKGEFLHCVFDGKFKGCQTCSVKITENGLT